jgi:peptidoglycan hydrolase-like protein with peptidoglycan-binding domain
MRFKEFLIEAPNPNATQQPAAPVAPAQTTFTLAVPQGNRGPAVADLQKALVALGHPLPKFGIDGIRGPETAAAVRKFQQDNQLKVDGIPGPETIAKLNSILAATPDVAKTLKKSTEADIKKSPTATPRRQPAPLKTDSVTQGKIGDLLNFIARYESGGNYNVVFRMKPDPNLTKMTIADVLKLQDQHVRNGSPSSAAGRYQYIRKTLRDTIAQMGIDPNKTLFDEKTQDAIATFTLRSVGLDNWLKGTLSDEQFLNKVAKIWAGIPTTKGVSAHDGDGLNKAGTTTQHALATLSSIKSGSVA